MSVKSPGLGAGGLASLANYVDSTFTVTLTGVDTVVTGTARYTIIGNQVTLRIPGLSGNSNATTCTLTGLPVAIRPLAAAGNQPMVIRDNGTFAFGYMQVNTDGTVFLAKSATASGTDWTNTGTKSVTTIVVSYFIN
jgi:hypothetical protein